MNTSAIRSLLDLHAGDWLEKLDPREPGGEYITPNEQLRAMIDGARLLHVATPHVREIVLAVWQYVDAVPGLDPEWAPELPFPEVYIAARVQIVGDAVARKEAATTYDLLGLLVTGDALFGHLVLGGGQQALVEVVARGEPRHRAPDARAADRGPIITFMLVAMSICHAAMLAGTTVVRVPGPARRKLERSLRDAPHAPVPRSYYTVQIEERIRWEGLARTFLVEQGPCYAPQSRPSRRHKWRSHDDAWSLRTYERGVKPPIPPEVWAATMNELHRLVQKHTRAT